LECLDDKKYKSMHQTLSIQFIANSLKTLKQTNKKTNKQIIICIIGMFRWKKNQQCSGGRCFCYFSRAHARGNWHV